MTEKKYIVLADLEVYKLAREISKHGWAVYDALSWQDKKVMGDQFIEAADSIGANIAEGYKRYHYLDKVKFYYNSRASLSETCDHWLELLYERGKIKKTEFGIIKNAGDKLAVKLANFIRATCNSRDNTSRHIS